MDKLNITDKTTFKKKCGICGDTNELTIANGGIIIHKELEDWGENQYKCDGFLRPKLMREKSRVLEKFYLVCPNCGNRREIGYRETDEFKYSEWSTLISCGF